MIQSTFRPSRIAVAGMVAVGMAIAVSSLGIVRAERVTPDKSKTYKCSSGTACVEGNSTGGFELRRRSRRHQRYQRELRYVGDQHRYERIGPWHIRPLFERARCIWNIVERQRRRRPFYGEWSFGRSRYSTGQVDRERRRCVLRVGRHHQPL
jgi:hypothetical protein